MEGGGGWRSKFLQGFAGRLSFPENALSILNIVVATSHAGITDPRRMPEGARWGRVIHPTSTAGPFHAFPLSESPTTTTKPLSPPTLPRRSPRMQSLPAPLDQAPGRAQVIYFWVQITQSQALGSVQINVECKGAMLSQLTHRPAAQMKTQACIASMQQRTESNYK